MSRIVHAFIVATLILGSSLAAAAPAGTLDTDFGIGGKRVLALPGGQDVHYPRMVRDSAGRIYMIVMTEAEFEDDVSALHIMRLHHDGTLDVSYGAMGTVTHLPQGPFDNAIRAAAIQPDGRIVIGFNGTGGHGIGTCRLLRDGSFDPGFGAPATPGCTDLGPEGTGVSDIVIQPDGRIVLTGRKSGTDSQGFVARLASDGTPDQDFGDNGVVLLGPASGTDFEAAALAPNGDIVVAGRILLSNYDFLVLRLAGTDGKPVASFGTWGLAAIPFDAGDADHDEAHSLKVLPDGGIVAAGVAYTDAEGTLRPAVVKLTAAGEPDASFGPGGKRIYDPCAGYADVGCTAWIYDLDVLPGERLVLAGSVTSATGSTAFLAMRLLANGEGDPEFGTDPAAPGTATVAFDLGLNGGGSDTALALAPEGERVLLAGDAGVATGLADVPYRHDFAVARLDHDLDTHFAVTPEPGPGGTLSPAVPQQIGHSDRAEFAIVPEPGFIVDTIEKGPGYCEGGVDGDVFVTAPVIQACEVHLTFKRLQVFADSYE